MSKYAPSITWKPDGRIIRAICGMCPDEEISATVPGARAHLFAHRDHVVALVTTTTTLLSISDSKDDVVAMPLDLRNAEGFRVSA